MHPIDSALGGRYRVERELGRGGMGTVYLARDVRLDRPIALKVLPAELASDAALRERFLRETRMAASFSHPNIVPVHAIEESEELLAFAMGFIEGESLAERVRRSGSLDARTVARLLVDVAYALAYAHGRGVVHRDIKPDNIMIERATGRALLMDFGISRTITAAVEGQGLTRVGEVVGTPEYMSPEQASGDRVDGRSDLYSLGLVALFALTGRTPVTGESTQQIIVRQLTEPLPPAMSLRADLPSALAEAIDRCVSKDPAVRYASAEALVDVLDRAQLAAPDIPLPIRLFAQELGTVGLVLVFILIVSTMLYDRGRASRLSSIDSIIPVMVLIGVAITRVLQVRFEARRLAASGFSVNDILKGMRAVLAEHESMRAVLRADAETHRRRRRTVKHALFQLPIAVGLIALALSMREQVGPAQFRIGALGGTLVITGLVMLGVAFILLARSPFRSPPGERLFRLVWLGPVGRAFVRSAARGTQPAATASTGNTGAPAMPAAPERPASVTISKNGDTRLAELEHRVRTLEEWRDQRSSP